MKFLLRCFYLDFVCVCVCYKFSFKIIILTYLCSFTHAVFNISNLFCLNMFYLKKYILYIWMFMLLEPGQNVFYLLLYFVCSLLPNILFFQTECSCCLWSAAFYISVFYTLGCYCLRSKFSSKRCILVICNRVFGYVHCLWFKTECFWNTLLYFLLLVVKSLLQIQYDVEDISKALSGTSHLQPSISHCSALLKVLPSVLGVKDVLVAHDTWSYYNCMLRVLKRYDFYYHKYPTVSGTWAKVTTSTTTSTIVSIIWAKVRGNITSLQQVPSGVRYVAQGGW